MTDLKPCRVCCEESCTCPAPKLPEGYLEREGVLYLIAGRFLCRFAWFEDDGTLYVDRQVFETGQAKALAAFLQRRSHD